MQEQANITDPYYRERPPVSGLGKDRQPQVSKELDLLEGQIKNLSASIEMLEDRLSPVLRQNELTKQSAAGHPEEIRVDLAQRIYMSCCAAAALTERLSVMMARLEL